MTENRQWVAAAALGVCLVGGAGASSAQDLVPGWGKARWGMSTGEVRALYPDLVAPEPKPNAKTDPDLKLETHRLLNQSFGILEGCDLKLRFLNEELWEILFACKAYEPADVRRLLEERYGYPQQNDPRQAVWRGETTRVSLNPRSGWFSISDIERGQWLTREVVRRMRQPQLEKVIRAAEEKSASPKETDGEKSTTP